MYNTDYQQLIRDIKPRINRLFTKLLLIDHIKQQLKISETQAEHIVQIFIDLKIIEQTKLIETNTHPMLKDHWATDWIDQSQYYHFTR